MDAEEQNAGIERLNREMAGVVPQQAEAVKEKKTRPKRKVSPKPKVILAVSKRKRAIARARLIKGTGMILVNGININNIKPKEIRELMLEPVSFSNLTRSVVELSNIKVDVHGGGASGQAQAVRSAIAKAIADAYPSDVVRKSYMRYDRTLLVDDSRRVEPKKFLGPKARARFQTSYR